MPCLLVGLGLFFPRLTIVLLAIFTDAITKAFAGWVLPVLGFFLLPFTTVAFIAAKNFHGSVDGIWIVVLILGILADLGSLGGGAAVKKRRKK